MTTKSLEENIRKRLDEENYGFYLVLLKQNSFFKMENNRIVVETTGTVENGPAFAWYIRQAVGIYRDMHQLTETSFNLEITGNKIEIPLEAIKDYKRVADLSSF